MNIYFPPKEKNKFKTFSIRIPGMENYLLNKNKRLKQTKIAHTINKHSQSTKAYPNSFPIFIPLQLSFSQQISSFYFFHRSTRSFSSSLCPLTLATVGE